MSNLTLLSLQSTLLKALAGKLGHSGLQVNGNIMYNGTPITEFLPQRTAVYVEQEDQHLPELTVRETFDFAARCQGVGGKAGRFCSSILPTAPFINFSFLYLLAMIPDVVMAWAGADCMAHVCLSWYSKPFLKP